MRCRSRAGFTLVEVMVALSISALMLVGARIALEQLGDSATRTASRAEQSDEAANGERVVRDLVLRTEPADETTPFRGTPTQAAFTSWCDVPSGWMERCAVTITVDRSAIDSIPEQYVTVRTSAGDMVTLVKAPRAELRYLLDAGSGGKWVTQWSGKITTPLALGVATAHDLTILRIGERR